MTFGLSIRTNAGELLLDDRFTVPALAAVVTPTYLTTHTLPGSTFVADEFSYQLPTYDPNHAGRPQSALDFWTLPQQPANVYFTPTIALTLNSTLKSAFSASTDSVLFFRPSSVSTSSIVVPTGYLFKTEYLTRSAEGWGLAVWKADGTLAFDLGARHLQLVGIASGVTYPPPQQAPGPAYSTSFSGLPATPAFFVAALGSENWTRRGNLNAMDGKFYNSGIRRDGNTLTTTNIQTELGSEDSLNRSSAWAGRTPTDLPYIDTSFYV